MDIIGIASAAMSKIDRSRSKAFAKKHPAKPLQQPEPVRLKGDRYVCGFAAANIMPNDLGKRTYMMAGFAPGLKCEGVHDPMTISAMWLGIGEGRGMFWITADFIGVSAPEVEIIRRRLEPFAQSKGCVAINFTSSHTHAGLDTCGYWGKLPKTGRVGSFMQQIYDTAEAVCKKAYENRAEGRLYAGTISVPGAVYRRRYPGTVRDVLTRLRFVPSDGGRETWFLNFSAHPNTLGKENRKVSADYPYYMRQEIYKTQGVNVMFTPGAIGAADIGQYSEDKQQRAQLGGEALAKAAFSIENDRELPCELKLVRRTMLYPDDNDTLTFLSLIGVVNAEKHPCADSLTGFALEAETTYIDLGGQKILCLTGELFAELAYGGYLSAEESTTGEGPEINPTPLCEIVGDPDLMIVGVTNGMTGYIVAPNDFCIRDDHSCLEGTKDRFGNSHYHETNSISVRCAGIIAATLDEMYRA